MLPSARTLARHLPDKYKQLAAAKVTPAPSGPTNTSPSRESTGLPAHGARTPTTTPQKAMAQRDGSGPRNAWQGREDPRRDGPTTGAGQAGATRQALPPTQEQRGTRSVGTSGASAATEKEKPA